ncbi:hypothetical protein B0H12DRAFT_696029 [Mycena haematopus]|nr:hypothetical protein B0H12DRAFT_696029 [Mycena haematopus]
MLLAALLGRQDIARFLLVAFYFVIATILYRKVRNMTEPTWRRPSFELDMHSACEPLKFACAPKAIDFRLLHPGAGLVLIRVLQKCRVYQTACGTFLNLALERAGSCSAETERARVGLPGG